MQAFLVEKTDRLVAKAGRERGDPECPMSCRLGSREHDLIVGNEAIEIVEDDVAVGERQPIVQHQGRHARQRIVGSNLVGVAEGRPGAVFEGDTVERERDAHATNERRVVLADQDHFAVSCLCWRFLGTIGLPRRSKPERLRRNPIPHPSS
ncbi:hypothetical protein D9M70_411370 [compost metagenome]